MLLLCNFYFYFIYSFFERSVRDHWRGRPDSYNRYAELCLLAHILKSWPLFKLLLNYYNIKKQIKKSYNRYAEICLLAHILTNWVILNYYYIIKKQIKKSYKRYAELFILAHMRKSTLGSDFI
jgi:hypothetical protein